MDRSGASVARVIEQIEAALVIAYDDWLKELARAIRGEASPEHGAEFASKILDRPDATARRIYDELDRLGLVVDIGKRYKVLDRVFASTPNIMDAIHDLFRCIKRELKEATATKAAVGLRDLRRTGAGARPRVARRARRHREHS